jgi:CRP-like cAMP-binding protein
VVESAGKTLAEFEQGDFFGEMALLTGQPRSADITAKTVVRCLVVDREGFSMILSKSPRIYENIQTIFNERMLDRDKKGMLNDKKITETSLLDKFRKIFMQ